MLSEVRRSSRGGFLDVSHLFPEPLFALVTLAPFGGTSPAELSAFLAEQGLGAIEVHRVDQVHSGRVVEWAEAPCEADALVCSQPGHAVRVVTADCVPILMATSDGARFAAVHAGWKGTLARIAETAALRTTASRCQDLAAYVGPAIGACCYAVDGARYAAFAEAFPERVDPACRDRRLDLPGLNAAMLSGIGVPLASITMEERCTACGDGLCCSYRRDGDGAGRMAAIIGKRR